MAFFKRLSDGFMSYMSPRKQDAALPTPPKTETKLPKSAVSTNQASLNNALQDVRSMSPSERVNSWDDGSTPSDTRAATPVRKRKMSFIEDDHRNKAARLDSGFCEKRSRKREMPFTETDHRKKAIRLDNDHTPRDQPRKRKMSFTDLDHGSKVARLEPNRSMNDQPSDNESSISSAGEELPVKREPGLDAPEVEDEFAPGEGLTVYADEYTESRRAINPTEEHRERGIATEELRAQGWDDDYIVLIQKIAMRGFEPLLPAYLQFDFRAMPDELFEAGHDAAFISSARGDHFRASLALERLFELGGRMRDRVLLHSRVTPEEQFRQQMQAYMRWAGEDAGVIDPSSPNPILVLECQPLDTPFAALKANARRQCADRVARFREQLRVQRSVETSLGVVQSELLAYPVPTVYAILASSTLVGLMAYRVDDSTSPAEEIKPEKKTKAAKKAEPGTNGEPAEPELKPMAYFDFGNVDYDVWNALALAIVVCHARNVQMRIAEETGIGLRHFDMDEHNGVEPNDPDA